jgi:hypothetical protein
MCEHSLDEGAFAVSSYKPREPYSLDISKVYLMGFIVVQVITQGVIGVFML